MRKILITVDTEGDNLWEWAEGSSITTENARFIPRFQDLCEEYGLIPTYLTNYEMATDKYWIEYGRRKASCGLCEIGMHIHAWNSPPYYHLDNKYGGNPYITEYPIDIVSEKIHVLKDILVGNFETKIESSRSGRWATNDKYFSALASEDIQYDCSVTPQLNLSKIPGCSQNCGNDYRKAPVHCYKMANGLIEIPMTTRIIRSRSHGSLKHRIKTIILGDAMWLRPLKKTGEELKILTSKVVEENTDYLEFMIHSSELMPGGSPYFRNNNDIEMLYKVIEEYFTWIIELGFEGSSVASFGQMVESKL